MITIIAVFKASWVIVNFRIFESAFRRRIILKTIGNVLVDFSGQIETIRAVVTCFRTCFTFSLCLGYHDSFLLLLNIFHQNFSGHVSSKNFLNLRSSFSLAFIISPDIASQNQVLIHLILKGELSIRIKIAHQFHILRVFEHTLSFCLVCWKYNFAIGGTLLILDFFILLFYWFLFGFYFSLSTFLFFLGNRFGCLRFRTVILWECWWVLVSLLSNTLVLEYA